MQTKIGLLFRNGDRHSNDISRVCKWNERIVSAGRDAVAIEWEDGNVYQRFEGHVDWINDMKVVKDKCSYY